MNIFKRIMATSVFAYGLFLSIPTAIADVNPVPAIGIDTDQHPLIVCDTHDKILAVMQSIRDNKLRDTVNITSDQSADKCSMEFKGVLDITAVDDIGIIDEPLIKHKVHFWIITAHKYDSTPGHTQNATFYAIKGILTP